MWTAGACCVSLARSTEGTLASGHIDGTLYLNGRLLLRYVFPPTALILLPPYVRIKLKLNMQYLCINKKQ